MGMAPRVGWLHQISNNPYSPIVLALVLKMIQKMVGSCHNNLDAALEHEFILVDDGTYE
jgi:hypothetical protein